MGEMLSELPKNKGGYAPLYDAGNKMQPASGPPTYAELGIEKRRALRECRERLPGL
jgi:hypothetical protein